MISHIRESAEHIEDKIIAYRRDFHKYAESGWTEFRTASLVARRLAALGFDVSVGRDVIADDARMGVPTSEILDACWQRAVTQGGDAAYLDQLKGGFTGAVGVLSRGNGPTIALRFDMDALDLQERQDDTHRPAREGFASVNANAMHACGHDGHTAIGLGVAEVLAGFADKIQGTIKLIFQPAEEGVRGAKSMVAAGVVNDVDYLLGHHLYSGWGTGEIASSMGNYLATTKFDATFTGAPAHAGGSPQGGKNALLTAATAILNLYAIPRHRQGTTRINVGRVVAGTGRNVIPAEAHLVIETRGATTELNDYMYAAALRVLESAAAMYDCDLAIVAMGAAQSANSDRALAQRVESVVSQIAGLSLRAYEGGGGSEDFTYMMRQVQAQGGLVVNIGIGASIGAGGGHTSDFDLDERAFKDTIVLLTASVLDLMANPKR